MHLEQNDYTKAIDYFQSSVEIYDLLRQSSMTTSPLISSLIPTGYSVTGDKRAEFSAKSQLGIALCADGKHIDGKFYSFPHSFN